MGKTNAEQTQMESAAAGENRFSSIFVKKNFPAVLLSGFLALVVICIAMNIWNADFQYLFYDDMGSDSMLEQMSVQNLIETGSRNVSHRLGGRDGQVLYDYPVSDGLNYAVMWFFSLFVNGSAAVINLFYLATYVFAAMAATYAFCRLSFSKRVSIFSGILYAFLYYHFSRNQTHLLLSGYYIVPLGCLVVIWLLSGELAFSFSKQQKIKNRIEENKTFFLAVLFSFLLSSTGIYYAFFFCFFICVAIGRYLMFERRWTRNLTAGLLCLGSNLVGVMLNLLPTLMYMLSENAQKADIVRSKASADYYGLKLLGLLAPNSGHRIPVLNKLGSSIWVLSPLSNENWSVRLGFAGSIGLIFLMLYPVIYNRKKLTSRGKLSGQLSFLFYSGFFLATLFGFGSVICWFITESIRAYNRISVFLSFFCLAALSIIFERVLFGEDRRVLEEDIPDAFAIPADSFGETVIKSAAADIQPEKEINKTVSEKSKTPRVRRIVYSILLIPLLIFCLYDQIPTGSDPDYEKTSAFQKANKEFFTAAEATVPEGTLVFQLPHIIFPEPEEIYNLNYYMQLSGYLNTKTLRWSAGSMRGYKEDKWAKRTSQLDGEDLISSLKKAGYGAVCIRIPTINRPRNDLAESQLRSLLTLLDTEPVYNNDRTCVFIPLE